jgi:photosystem II stability/assembly factor-like uncharacterized protein
MKSKTLLLVSLYLFFAPIVSAQWLKKYQANFPSPTFYATGKIIAPDSMNMRAIGWKRTIESTTNEGGAVLTNLNIQYSNNGGNTVQFSNPVINIQDRFMSDIFALNKDTTFVITTKTYNALAMGFPSNFIYKSVKGVDSFAKVSSNNMFLDSAWADFICFFDNKNGCVVGDPNYDTANKAIGKFFEIYTTTDCGTSWLRIPSAQIPKPLTGEFPFTGITSNSYAIIGNTIWFVTNASRVFRSSDKGQTWTTIPLTIPQNRSSRANNGCIAFKDSINGLIGINGCVYKTQDGGDTWNLVYDYLVSPVITSPRFTAGNIIYAKGTDGLFIGTNEKFGDIRSNSIVGQGKTWYSYDGIEWKLLGTTFTGNNYDKMSLSALCFENATNAWIGGLDATVYKWGSKKLPPNFQLLSPIPTQKLLCGKNYPLPFSSSDSDSARIDISTDNGATWSSFIKYAWGSKLMTWKAPTSPMECKLKMIALHDTGYNKISSAFTIELPQITTVFPKGGEILEQNKEYNVSWSSSNVDSVNVYFTTDSGTTWTQLTKGIQGNALLKWTTPIVSSSKCAIRVAAHYDTSYYYQSSYFSILNSTSINELAHETITIYPNPVHDILTIETNRAIEKVALFNLLGEEIIITNELYIDCSKLSAGLYVLKLINAKEICTKRFTKF